MPKVKWSAADSDNALTADDIDNAENNGFEPYAGDIPSGGVYRFRIKRIKRIEFSTGNQGFNVLMELDGSWKEKHAEYNGCPLWDRVVMTKSAASFAKAFAVALGVSSADLINRVVVDDSDVVTKIGNKTLTGDDLVYVSVKRGSYNDEPRLESAGTGYIVVEESTAPAGKKAAKAAPAAAEEEAKPGKAKKAKKGKAVAEEEAPF